MKLVGVFILFVLAPGALLPALANADEDEMRIPPERSAKVLTDGRLRPGHLETIRVAGFPGKGIVEVSFFPTAICEDGCGARSFRVGKTAATGAGEFRVRVPGTFFNLRERNVFFRDRERIDVNVTWEGPNRSFAVAFADPQPILVRSNGKRR